MSEQLADAGSTSVTADTADSRKSARRTFTLLYAMAMVAAAAGLIFVWTIWNTVWGDSLRYLVTYGIVVLATLLSVGWLIAFSPFRWKTVIAVLGVSVVLAMAVAASVRTFEFDGDMGLVVHYRWEPTAHERLVAHRQSAGSAPKVIEASELPQITAEDSPAYRGDDRSGEITGPKLSQDWQQSPPPQLWKQPCGGGYSAFSVVGNFAVTLEQRGENEAVVCYDAASGAERWVHEYPASFVEAMGGPGPRATPTIADADVYSLGAEGDFVCLDLGTGQPRWHVHSLPEGKKNVMWALSSSPLVVENLVIVETGGPDGDGLIAYDRSQGDVVWQRPGVEQLPPADAKEGANLAGYSSPVLVSLQGVRQVVIFDGAGLRGHVPETGEELWFHEFKNDPGVNVAQPIFFDDGRIFLSQSYSIGSRMIRLSHDDGEWTTEELWSNLNMKCKFTSPVLHEGYLYGLDEGILVCLDSETGERTWKKGRYGHGQILLTNGQIVVLSEKGVLALVDPDPKTFKEVTRFTALKASKVWNPHTLAGGIVYIRNHEEMAAYDLRPQ